MTEVVMEQARRAKAAARRLATVSTDAKNAALLGMADALIEHTAEILDANEVDLCDGRKRALSTAMLDRLMLDERRIQAMATGLHQIAALPGVRRCFWPLGLSISSDTRSSWLSRVSGSQNST